MHHRPSATGAVWQRCRPARMACLLCLSWPWLALAQPTSESWLPPPEQVQATLRAQPAVLAAIERVNAARATQQALAVGPHEFQGSAGIQRRNIPEEGQRYQEWEFELGRAIRLPAKARLDQEIGAATLRLAGLRLAEAEHQALRNLLDAWSHWLRSAAVAAELAAQDRLLADEKQILGRRLALGDAAQREMDVLTAEFATQAAQSMMAQDEARALRQALISGFPEVILPMTAPPLPEPQEFSGDPQVWLTPMLEHNERIGMAHGEASRLAKVAERVRAERVPDPTLGLRVMSDRGGAERTVGLVLTVPLAGEHRTATAAAENATAIAAEAEALAVRRSVEQEARAGLLSAQSKYAQWLLHQQALTAQATATARTRRAWELGEIPLSEYLLAQRSLRQARVGEAQARGHALQAALLVRIDAHALWHSTNEAQGRNALEPER